MLIMNKDSYVIIIPINLLLESDPTIDLTNTDDLTYTGPIYLGTNQVAGTVIYDTGSGWLTITSSEC
jgi:hypothetical protein